MTTGAIIGQIAIDPSLHLRKLRIRHRDDRPSSVYKAMDAKSLRWRLSYGHAREGSKLKINEYLLLTHNNGLAKFALIRIEVVTQATAHFVSTRTPSSESAHTALGIQFIRNIEKNWLFDLITLVIEIVLRMIFILLPRSVDASPVCALRSWD